MAQTFLQAVNRILRISGVIRGDTDGITTFADLQHGSSMNLAIIAIQSTLTDLTAYYDFPTERTAGTITLQTGVRTYALATDFVQFWNEPAYFYDAVQNNEILEYDGGERRLAREIFTYQTQLGYPTSFYYVEGATKLVGFYAVPDSSLNNRVLSYDYEKDVIPLLATDNLPFIRDIETFKFCDLAAVKFNSLFTQQPRQPSADIEKDPAYITARATLLKLIKPEKPSHRYGPKYS